MLKRIVISCCLGWTLIAMPIDALASLNQQMDAMFGSLANTTNPQVYMGQRMGAFFGGSALVKNRIVNASIFGFVPPHISAGCGGIDMFGGSFSFINAKQFTNLLRGIASNAQGYFFQLAMQAMCPTCANIMSSFQKSMQKLNQAASNSCTLAKSLVDSAVVSSIPNNTDPESRLGRMKKLAAQDQTNNGNAFQDIFDAGYSIFNHSNTDARIKKADPTFLTRKKYVGNITWDLIKQQNINAWVPFGDNDFMENIMSMTGVFIITDVTTPVVGAGGVPDKTSTAKPMDATIDIKTLINGTENGAKVDIYRCTDMVACMGPKPKAAPNFKGFKQRIDEVLLGTGGSIGILQKLAHPTVGVGYTPAEKSYMDRTNTPIVGMLRNIAQYGEQTMKIMEKYIAPWLAREQAAELMAAMLDMMQKAANQGTPEMKPRISAYKAMLNKRADEVFKQQQIGMKTDNQFLRFLQGYQALRMEHVGLYRPGNPSSTPTVGN